MTHLWLLPVTKNVRRPWPVAVLSDAPGTAREARRPTRGGPEERVKVVLACTRCVIRKVGEILAFRARPENLFIFIKIKVCLLSIQFPQLARDRGGPRSGGRAWPCTGCTARLRQPWPVCRSAPGGRGRGQVLDVILSVSGDSISRLK